MYLGLGLFVHTKSVHRKRVLPFRTLLSSLVIEWRIIRCVFRSFIVCLESIEEAKRDFVCKVSGETESANIVHTLVLLGKLSYVAVGANTERVGPTSCHRRGGGELWLGMNSFPRLAKKVWVLSPKTIFPLDNEAGDLLVPTFQFWVNREG